MRGCGEAAEAGAPVPLCTSHLLEAYDWVSRDVGVTDVLPSPCLACGSRLGVRYPSGWLCAICEWRVGEIPDADEPVLRVDVVYYLRYKDRVKIGTSGNPRSRIAALPHDATPHDGVLAFERGDRLVERRRHAQFASHRIPRTEWFEQNDELDRHIDELRAGTDDPWALYALWRSQAIALRR